MESSGTQLHQVRILPALRQIQEKYGYLNLEAMRSAARQLDIPQYRFQEVAGFFPHFRLAPPAQVTVRVCRDMACHMAGSGKIIERLKSKLDSRIRVEGVSCLGRCDRPVAACVAAHNLASENYYLGRSTDDLKRIIDDALDGKVAVGDLDATLESGWRRWKINPYASREAQYEAVRKVADAKKNWEAKADRPVSPVGDAAATSDAQSSDAVLAELDEAHANLRGMGGAGIPATQKWRDVRDAVRSARQRGRDDRAFVIVNADESEPGTFKDRELLLRFPHLIVEGLIIAGAVTDATEGFIYIRHEYHEQIEACRAEIKRAEELGLCGTNARMLGRSFPISVFVSPGGYICGEQSALVEAMSDRRAEPRNLPPKLETNGLEDQPTLVSNVETYAWVPYILLHGGKGYASEGVNSWRGRRFFSVSGDVKRPGVYEVPMGLPVRELIFGKDYCQGMAQDKKLKSIAPSGPSGGFLPTHLTATRGLPWNLATNKAWQDLTARRGMNAGSTSLDILDLELELDLFRAISPTQALGAGIVVYAEGRNMLREALNALEFFAAETCGKCVPCRIGSQKLVGFAANLVDKKVSQQKWNQKQVPLMRELSKAMELTSICALGRSAPLPLRTAIEFFPDDVAAFFQSESGAGGG